DRDSCVDKSRCQKYGNYAQCTACCKKAGHNKGTCDFFKCKCT
uniref:Potassium channel toxin gamma-KTx 3.4 n=1 Tax=Centruroides gracilis TaxID=217898 RepID=KGX34_CENGR